MNGPSVTWEELARREFHAAQVGGETWARFVAEAEQITGESWNVIRERLNAIHKRDGLPQARP